MKKYFSWKKNSQFFKERILLQKRNRGIKKIISTRKKTTGRHSKKFSQ